MASSELRPLLLDVNALMALGWPNHQFHGVVVDRLEQQRTARWATCALTQLGFVRLSSNPAIVDVRKTPAEALAALAGPVADLQHYYLKPMSAPVDIPRAFRRLLGHQQVTDAYLLAVAAVNDSVLLTLDQRLVPPSDMRRHLEVLTA
jgi:toxin-antitoxin system PIN domain toxin